MEISKLTLYANKLEEQFEFYTQTLGFVCVKKTDDSFTLEAGKSLLTFTKKKNSTPYHFAFNIPYDAVEDALQWVKERVDVLKDGRFEINEFLDWDARAVYFYDEDKNIVELIGRQDLNYEYPSNFDINCVKEISEVGVATTDIEACYNSLSAKVGLGVYDGGFYRFCAIGAETGMFICVNREEKKWFPTDDEVYYSPFTAEVNRYNLHHSISYENGKLDIKPVPTPNIITNKGNPFKRPE